MTSAHAAQRRRASPRRSRARRRTIALLVLAAVGGVLVASLLPTVRDAAKQITLPLGHEDIIRQQAREKGLDPALIAAVIYAESKFADDRTSHAGARGLMQITPETARAIALRTGGVAFRQADLADPQINISYGSWYLRNLLDRYGGNRVLALAAYNAGQGNVDRWIARAQVRGQPLTVDAIPFGETRAYVDRVLGARDDYRRTYARQLGF